MIFWALPTSVREAGGGSSPSTYGRCGSGCAGASNGRRRGVSDTAISRSRSNGRLSTRGCGATTSTTGARRTSGVCGSFIAESESSGESGSTGGPVVNRCPGVAMRSCLLRIRFNGRISLGPGPVRGVVSEEPSAAIPHARVCEGGGSWPSRDGPADLLYSESDEKGPAARRRPTAAREAYSLYVERAAEGANAADGPLSSL